MRLLKSLGPDISSGVNWAARSSQNQYERGMSGNVITNCSKNRVSGPCHADVALRVLSRIRGKEGRNAIMFVKQMLAYDQNQLLEITTVLLKRSHTPCSPLLTGLSYKASQAIKLKAAFVVIRTPYYVFA